MKQTGIFRKLVASSVALLVMSFAVNVQAEARQATAKVRAIRGTAQVSVAGGGWTALKVNETLKAGSIIRTGSESTVDVFLNNSVVRITPETTMAVDKLQIENTGADNIYQTQLNLKSGRILGNVKKLARASKYEIKTPTGVAGIRGTDFDIKVTPLGGGRYKLTITSITGTIVGSAVNSQNNVVTAVINTGETWDPDAAGIAFLPADDLRILQGIIQQLETDPTLQPPTVSTPTSIIHVSPVTGDEP